MLGSASTYVSIVSITSLFVIVTAPVLCRLVTANKRDLLFGALALRWNMRFSRKDYVGLQSVITGIYHGAFGHSRKVSASIVGKYKDIPVVVFDYEYELGSKVRRKYEYKTVFVAETGLRLPHILILPEHHISPIGEYSSFHRLDFIKAYAGKIQKKSVLSHFCKYHIYSEQLHLLDKIFDDKVLERLSMLKHVSIEIQGSKVIVWSERVQSNLRIAVLLARTIKIAKSLKLRSQIQGVS